MYSLIVQLPAMTASHWQLYTGEVKGAGPVAHLVMWGKEFWSIAYSMSVECMTTETLLAPWDGVESAVGTNL